MLLIDHFEAGGDDTGDVLVLGLLRDVVDHHGVPQQLVGAAFAADRLNERGIEPSNSHSILMVAKGVDVAPLMRDTCHLGEEIELGLGCISL